MSLSLRSLALASLVSALSLVLLTPGCSRQGEGERCDVVNGNSDCDDGLKCIAKNNLVEGIADRCCNPDGTTFSDSRCQPGSGGPSGVGGNMPTAGSASTAGGQGGAGEPDPGPGGSGGSGGFPSSDDGAGAGGVPTSSAGMPGMSEGGNPNGGVPAGGQGGAD